MFPGVPFEYHRLPTDDPTRRQPDIGRARSVLNWSPKVDVEEGLRRTVEWFRARPEEVSAAAVAVAGEQFEGRHRTPVLS